MKYKILGLTIVFAVIAVAGFVSIPGTTSSAAESSRGVSIVPKPTPQTAKTKTIREITFIDGEFDGEKLVQTDDEWKKVLTSDEYYVMRQEGTERPYTGTLLKNKKVGTYHCAACGLALFSSKAKYDSQTGWPSFYKPAFKKNVTEQVDRSLGDERIEIECSRCGAHLGHVFDDGPQPTGLRYCMNSISLKFKAAK
ncbi:MAG: peptide-methionine (R)-S-oxide reductase MsrB [Pyrinomonadaceae bacterium]